jgi:hypothetical protein
MSSVLRFLKQTPSKTIFNENGADVYTYAAIQTAVAANSGSFLGESMVLFPESSNLITALGAIVSQSTSSDTAMLDMGARLFMGVEGADSELVVFGLVKVIQGTNADAALVGYVCLQDETSTLDVGVSRGAW